MTTSLTELNQNPLLSDADAGSKWGAIAFDKIRPEHFLPALQEGLRRAYERLEALKASAEPLSFSSIFERLECISEESDFVSEVFFNLLSAEAGSQMHALAKEISPLLAKFSNDISLDQGLFEKVKLGFAKLKIEEVGNEKYRLAEKTYKAFVRGGALLDETEKQKLREIDEDLSRLSPQFSENVLKATYAFELEITQEKDLAGLPEGAVQAAKETAKAKNKASSWIFTLEQPSLIPFVTYADNRELRKKLWFEFSSRCLSGPYDNSELLKKIATLKHNRANLLGFKSHAEFVLKDRMAETPEKVETFLNDLLKRSRPAAQRELDEVMVFAKNKDRITDFGPWDFAYYSEKLKQEKFDFDEEALRPYFQLEKVVQGLFDTAKILYSIEFKPLKDVPVYHSDVKVFEVTDLSSKKYLGLFYADFFPRETKKGGAWMTPLREQGKFGGKIRRPHISIVCNLTKPTQSKPSLLNLDEVKTLFHEFGHALHGLLSDCEFRSMAGTNVYWDFVELPSQIMENWMSRKEGLDIFASHYETGQKLPADLAEKIRKADQFQSGWQTLRQLSFGILDLAWHKNAPQISESVEALEKRVLTPLTILARVPGTSISAAFSHIFAGGYSAGYYSYKWAEVLDADAFELFEEKGIFNPEVARSFRENILSKGGTEHPAKLYRKFRGRDPDPRALLRRSGLLNESA